MDPVDSDCAQIVAIYSWMEKPLRAEYEVGPQRFDAVTNVRRKTNIKNAVKYFEKQDPEMLPHERDAILDFLLEAFVKSRADPAYDYDKAIMCSNVCEEARFRRTTQYDWDKKNQAKRRGEGDPYDNLQAAVDRLGTALHTLGATDLFEHWKETVLDAEEGITEPKMCRCPATFQEAVVAVIEGMAAQAEAGFTSKVLLTPDEIASRAHMATQSSRNRLSIFEKLTRQIHVLFHAPIDGSEPLAFPQHVASLAKAYRSLDLPKVSDVNRKIVRNELSQLYKSAREGLEIPEAMRAIHAELFDAADATFKQPVTAIEDGQLVSRTNVEALFNQIVHPAQQVGAIARARAFLFAACERRAVRGESLDPMSFCAELFHELHAPQLETVWHARLAFIRRLKRCMDSLSNVVHLYAGRDQLASVKRLAEQLNPPGRAQWASLLWAVPPPWQEHAATACETLSHHVQSCVVNTGSLPLGPLTEEAVVDLLARLHNAKLEQLQQAQQHPDVGHPHLQGAQFALGAPRRRDRTNRPTADAFFPRLRIRRW